MDKDAALSDAGLKTPEELVGKLLDLLRVEELDTDLYRGPRLPGGVGRVFGGQVIAQALVAANRSVEGDFIAHSLHAYFMRPGNEDFPIIYRVVRDRDGRSFATRRIIALQKGKPILNMAANFQRPEEGLSHQVEMPDVPPPEELQSAADFWRDNIAKLPPEHRKRMLRQRAIEQRPVDEPNFFHPEKRSTGAASWFRAVAPFGGGQAMQQAVLAYASDMTLLGASTLPHGISWMSHPVQMASLDHSLWLHEEFDAGDWLLYTTDSPWTGHARGFNRGQIFSRDGRLVASVAQEGLMRLRA